MNHYYKSTAFGLVIIIRRNFKTSQCLRGYPTDKLRVCIKHGNKPVPGSKDLYTAACFMFLKHFAVSDFVPIHVASHLFILVRAMFFGREVSSSSHSLPHTPRKTIYNTLRCKSFGFMWSW